MSLAAVVYRLTSRWLPSPPGPQVVRSRLQQRMDCGRTLSYTGVVDVLQKTIQVGASVFFKMFFRGVAKGCQTEMLNALA